jgi:plastocyanin
MRKLSIILAVVGLVFVGCSSDKTTTAGDTTTTAGGAAAAAPVKLDGTTNNKGTKDAADGATLEIEQDSFYFNPTFIKSTPGAKITVNLKNDSSAPHTFTIDALNIDTEVKAGSSDTVEVTLPDSGATLFYCRFHQSKGMQGAFFFKDGDTVNAAAATTGGSY